MVITPWRSVLICDLDEGVADAALRVLAPLGLVFDETSPWLDVSACTGSPGCAHRPPTSAATPRWRSDDVGADQRGRPPALRRLRAGLRQPTDRPGAGGDRGRLRAAPPVG